MGDCGLTGRKIIADTYGGQGSHGGGGFSGKDPSKVDRTASYMARYVAKNIVAADFADRVEVQVAYSIGMPEPISLMIDTFGTGRVPDEKIEQIVLDLFSFKPANMIKYLKLTRPIFRKTACGGHFGRTDPDFTWEKTDMVETLRDKAGLNGVSKQL
jgi:S-adenosylmethionine synthetase